MIKHIIPGLFLLCCASSGYAQEAKSYKNAQGGEITFPLGELSFADEVVSFEMGKPSPRSKAARRQANILGEPVNASLSLGCSGVVVVRFIDNALVDIEGPDLYVFEIGPQIEATNLEISGDGRAWIDVGPISGSTAAIDIAGHIPDAGAVFHYVRLMDRNIGCRAGNYSGADIDAVGAIGAAVRITLSGNVLFDFDSAELRDEAQAELQRVTEILGGYPGARVVVEGHTDSKGSDSYNLKLSSARAESVRDYLVASGSLIDGSASIAPYGESRPVAENETDEGRQANRRVDIIVIPAGK